MAAQRFGGDAIATNSTFTIASAQPSDSGNYDVLVTNNFYAVTSLVVSVTVTNLAIITQPVSVTAGYAGAAAFTVVAVGAQPLFYQWWQNGSPVAGATNSTLDALAVDPRQRGQLLCRRVEQSGVAAPARWRRSRSRVRPVTLTPVFDGTNAAASGYAYAGSSDINAASFICSGLMTVGNQQFFAYYGQHQTNPSYAYNGTIWIARRTVGANVWQIFRTTFTPDDITDGHDVVAFGIDGSNYMHLSWGMHDATPIHYARSTAPVTGNQRDCFRVGSRHDDRQTSIETEVTYPQFLTLPNGDLLFFTAARRGSGGGDTCLNRWSLASQTWTNVNSAGTPCNSSRAIGPHTNYNAYPNMPCLDAAGNFYLAWTWRETPAYESNHDLNYAKSTNGGVTWQRFNGTPYDLPILKTAEPAMPMSFPYRLSPFRRTPASSTRPACASTPPTIRSLPLGGRRVRPRNYQRQYMVVFPDTNGVWQTRQVSNRTNDPTGTMELDAVVRDLGRPVVVCDKQNRIIVLYRDNFGSNGLTLVSFAALRDGPAAHKLDDIRFDHRQSGKLRAGD